MCKELFKRIDSVIRSERLYANVDLMREDVMKRFSISRHRLNALLNQHAGGLSFPQYINKMRVEEAHELIVCHVFFDDFPQTDRLRDFVFLTSKMIGI